MMPPAFKINRIHMMSDVLGERTHEMSRFVTSLPCHFVTLRERVWLERTSLFILTLIDVN